MPELPEVETVRQVLTPLLVGHTISDILILKKRIIVSPIEQFKQELIGSTFTKIDRIGKYLIFIFDNQRVMVSHLRMEGKYIEVLPGQELSRFARVVFTLDDGRKICYDDSRQFGTMELSNLRDYQFLPSLQKLGPEPFFADYKQVYKRLQKTSRPIKEGLLDQTIMTGLGNIYVDEVLFLAKLHPQYPSNKLTLSKVKDVVTYAIEVLNKAIQAGGSTIRSYHPGNGITGDFQSRLNAYGREYLQCFNCGDKMKKIFVGGRGSTYCPRCQRNPLQPLVIAITGQISAGKSTVGSYLKTKNYCVFDADQIVNNLYQDKSVITGLEKELAVSLQQNGEFNKDLLKLAIISNPKLLKKVENYIHPLVKQTIIDIITTSREKVLFFEVPLVFSHKINELFAYIIGIETDKATQEKFLSIRGGNKSINPDQQYLKNRPKLDYIIINNKSLENLYHLVDHVIEKIDI